jgi:TetR/AcrR family transcriptional regulator, cholesterol catabolism regulator
VKFAAALTNRRCGRARRTGTAVFAILASPSKQLLCTNVPASRERTHPKNSGENRRGELVRAAAQLFREKGFEATTIRDIAGAVGMQSGSPFYHFANKHELLMAVMEEGLRLGLERTHAVVAASGLTPVDRFRGLVRAHYGILHETGSDFIPVMLYNWRSLPATYRHRIIELKDRYDALWQATLDALHAEGRLGADARIARLMILGAINFSATWYRAKPRSRTGLDLDTLAEQTAALFLREAPP